MTMVPLRFVLAALLALLLVGCAPQTELVKLYENPAAGNRQYERLFVVAIAGDVDMRRQLEDVISEELRRSGAAARSAYTITGSKTTLTQDEINEAARASGSDAIIVTHIVRVDTKAETEEGRTDIKSECRSGDPADYFLYDYEELKEPDSVKLALTVVAVTNLYDAADGERMWSIQSTCFEKATMDEVMIDEANTIARQLKIDGLIG